MSKLLKIDVLHELRDILTDIENVLAETHNEGQAEFICQILILIENNNVESAIKMLDSAEFWGGSGSVLDTTYNFNTTTYERFQKLLKNLLILMKKEKILGRYAKTAYKKIS